jgi:hypothetical protein
MIVTITVIVLMVLADANQDTVVLTAQPVHAPMIALDVEVATNLFVSAMKDTWDLIAH